MISVKYRLFNPTGNITALVETFVAEENQPAIAKEILEMEPTCEQVGFLSEGINGCDITMRMAGGEFCGNATMSTAVYLCEKCGLHEGEIRKVLVNVVGTKEPVPVTVSMVNGIYTGEVKMPKAMGISEKCLEFEHQMYRYPLVEFEGISHIVIEDDMSKQMAENAVKLWCQKLGCEGLGLMLLSKDRSVLNPLVYVRNPETLYWESSCASGTTAVGVYLSNVEKKDVEYAFNEPGGTLKIKAMKSGDLYLTGTVKACV